MIQIIAIVLVIVAFGAWSAKCYELGGDQRIAAYEAKLKAADDKVVAAQKARETEAANHIDDMVTAYETGEQDAKASQTAYVQQAKTDVAKYPVFANPACVLPDASLHVLNAARAGLQSTADTGGTPATVPGAPAAFGWEAGNPVPAKPGGPGAVVPVPPATGEAGGSGQVPANGVQPVHAKPRPVS